MVANINGEYRNTQEAVNLISVYQGIIHQQECLTREVDRKRRVIKRAKSQISKNTTTKKKKRQLAKKVNRLVKKNETINNRKTVWAEKKKPIMEQLYRLYFAMILRIVKRKVFQPAQIADAISVAVIALFECTKTFDTTRSDVTPDAYIWRCIVHAVEKHLLKLPPIPIDPKVRSRVKQLLDMMLESGSIDYGCKTAGILCAVTDDDKVRYARKIGVTVPTIDKYIGYIPLYEGFDWIDEGMVCKDGEEFEPAEYILPDTKWSPEKSIFGDPLESDVREAFSTMSVEDRECFLLRYNDGNYRTREAVSRILGISVYMVSKRYKRAEKHLQKALSRYAKRDNPIIEEN